jgi:prepilin-type processing-associated H-X9-DG protein
VLSRRIAAFETEFETLVACLSCLDFPRNSRQRSCDVQGIRDRRPGFTILELVVSVGIVMLLAALILPAIGSAREAARRTQCMNNLRQIGLALHTYHDQHRSLPAGWVWEASKPSGYGWAASLVPYLEDNVPPIYRNLPLSDPRNRSARQTRPEIFVCPSDITEPVFTLVMGDEDDEDAATAAAAFNEGPPVELPAANYLGVFGTIEPDDDVPPPPGDGAFLETRPVSFSQFLGGLSNTIIVGERTTARLPSTWLGVDFRAEDAACRLVGNAATAPNCAPCDECEFGSRHSKGANFLFGDGHVKLLSTTTEADVYRRMARRSGL